jgi:pyrimidine-specific ribonucleoside hydrolase
MLVFATLVACGGDDDSAAEVTTDTSPATQPATTPAATTTIPVPTATPILIDTDLAADDIVALTYLDSHPDVDLLAVTVSGTGEVRCPRGADVARGLLALMDRADVPVACGRSVPSSAWRQFPEPWRNAADNAWGLMLEVVTPPEQRATAVDVMIDAIGSSPVPVTVLVLGPMTNLAQALDSDPDLIGNVERVVIMGGAVDVPGNVYPDGASEPLAAEWNFYIDPAAAAAVVDSGVPITLVALDATNAVALGEDLVDRLAANDTNEATARVLQLFGLYPPEYLWDPLAAIAAAEPDMVPGQAAEIEVVLTGDAAGQTLRQSGGSAVELASPPATTAVIDHLLKTLAGIPDSGMLATPTTVPVLGEVAVSFDGSTCSYAGPQKLTTGAYVVTAEPGPVPYVVAIAHLADGATVDEVLAWIAAHPGEEPPMVDEVTAVGGWGEPSPASVVFPSGTVAVACGAEDGAVTVAASLDVSG